MAWRTLGSLVTVALLGCTMNNPAFDEARATDGLADTGSEATSEQPPLETGEEETSANSETSGSSETGVSESSDTGTEEVCDYLVRPALRLAVDVPDGVVCPDPISELFLLLDVDTLNQPAGMATGMICGNSTCETCTSLSYSVGAPGFPGLAEVWTALGAVVDGEGIDGLCVEVAAAKLVGEVDGACVYESLGIWDSTIEHGPVFVGNVDAAPLTWIGELALAQLPPPAPSDSIGACSCASVHDEVNKLTELQCCEDSGFVPKFYALSFLDTPVLPGMSKPVAIQQLNWKFHAVQAQVVPGCANQNGDLEQSWALARVE